MARGRAAARPVLAGAVALAVVLGLAALGQARPPSAAAQRVEPGGAPPAGTPPIDVAGPIRVIDGDTLEAWVDGKRTGIGLLGVTAPRGNTPCGRQATGHLWGLVRGGVRLVDDPSVTFDGEGRRMFVVASRDGRSLAEEQARAGLAQADGRGAEQARVAQAAAEARAAGRGCVGPGGAFPSPAPPEPAAGGAVADGGEEPRAAPGLTAGDGKALAVPLEALLRTALPTGFTEEVVASGLTQPTAFAFLPDGRLLLAEKDGLVKVVKNGALLATPLLDLRDRVNDYWDHGLLGIAADPGFAANGYVYLLYTYEHNPADYSGPKTGRLARYTVSGDAASAGSEAVVLGTQVGSSCNAFPAGSDCIPSDSPSHSVGALKFAPDGSLFVTLGDGAHFNYVDDNALRAQNLDLLSGKLLRITTGGRGVPGNPHWTGSADANRSKVWARGLRNAYRFNLRPGTSVPYVGEVGWNGWEEINVPGAGANLGWPCYEGTARQSGYEPKGVCQTLYGQGSGAVKAPLVAWNHSAGSSAATGGAFYTGTGYPAQYQGAYVYGDYAQNWLRALRVTSDNTLESGPTDFGTDAQGPVAIEMGPDGDLYYLAIAGNQLRRVRYVGGPAPVSCPVGQYLAEYFNNRTLGGTPAVTRCEPAVAYDWGTAAPVPGIGVDNFSVRWTGTHPFAAGTYTFTARADDGIRVFLDGAGVVDAWIDQSATTYTAVRSVAAGEHQVKVEYYENGVDAVAQVSWAAGANRPPVATISAPATTLRYKVGDQIAFAGAATDPEDGAVPPANLTWQVLVHHCPGGVCHTHYDLFTPRSGAGGSFDPVPDHDDATHLEVLLTATDSAGLTGTASVTLQPLTVQLTLTTSPAGLDVVYNGERGPAPLTRTAVVGATRTIFAPSPQGAWTFAAWSDTGSQQPPPNQHNVLVGASDTTYTATFTGGPPTATPVTPPTATPVTPPTATPVTPPTATPVTPPTATPVTPPTATAVPAPPTAPTNLTARAPGNSRKADLVWTDRSGNETGFSIERSTGGGAFVQIATVGPNVTVYSNTGLAGATTYAYRVRAFNAVGDSAYSNVASVTTR